MLSIPFTRFALLFLAGVVLARQGVGADTLTLRPDRLPGGESTFVTLTLDRAPATDTDFSIMLSGANSAQARPTVQIRAGQVSAEFKVTSSGALNQEFVDIAVIDPRTKATLAKAHLVVHAAVLTSLTLNKSAVVGGTPNSPVTGTVTLYGLAPAPGLTVLLGQTCPNCQQGVQQLSLPQSVQVASGSRSATFTFEAPRVNGTERFAVLASQAGVVKTAGLEVGILRPQSITVSPATISGAQQATVTITLNASAFSGYRVHLSCSQSLATDVSSQRCRSVTANDPYALIFSVPAGQTSVSCHISNDQLSPPTQVTLRAENIDGNGVAQTTLSVAP